MTNEHLNKLFTSIPHKRNTYLFSFTVFFQLKLEKIQKRIKPIANKVVVRWAVLYLEGGGVNCFLEKQLGNMKQSWTHMLFEEWKCHVPST